MGVLTYIATKHWVLGQNDLFIQKKISDLTISWNLYSNCPL